MDLVGLEEDRVEKVLDGLEMAADMEVADDTDGGLFVLDFFWIAGFLPVWSVLPLSTAAGCCGAGTGFFFGGRLSSSSSSEDSDSAISELLGLLGVLRFVLIR